MAADERRAGARAPGDAAEPGRDGAAWPSHPLGQLTRRQVLRRAGIGAATLPLVGWLAGCAGGASSARRAPTPTPTPSPTPSPTPDTRPITIAITGDIMLGRGVNTQMLARAGAYPFTYTADYLRGFDLTVGNLECVVSTLASPCQANPSPSAPIRRASRG